MAKQKANALEHNISLFSHKMVLANQKAGALEMLLGVKMKIGIFKKVIFFKLNLFRMVKIIIIFLKVLKQV